MPKIELLPAGQVIEAARGLDLLEVTRQAGLDIEAPCGGEGTCGRCIVRLAGGEVQGDSVGRIPSPALAAGYVLACRTRLLDSPVVVEIPEHEAEEVGQFADDETPHLVDVDLMPDADGLSPLAVKRSLRVPAAQLEDGLSDLDRLTRAMREQCGCSDVRYELAAMRSAALALRAEDGHVTVTTTPGSQPSVIAVEAGGATGRHFGLAVDLGTTSVAVQLVDLQRGRILATRSDYNAQIPLGVDVISRINAAAKPGRLEELRSRALQTINELTCTAAISHAVNPGEICAAVVSGNTVMTHLLLGLMPEHIRLEPYTPTVKEPPELRAAEIGLGIGADAPVRLSPCVGSYVGGDITAGLLCTPITQDRDSLILYVDIGTNGELVIGNGEFLMACACSAGPAFEGGGILCGMRAATGAIERVAIDPESAQPSCSTVGGGAARGICGSGLIDLVANLLRSGWIDRCGSLDRSRGSAHVLVEGKSARLVLVSADDSATGEAITISEAEIENVIRAKAAIYSASALMLKQVGLNLSDLGQVCVAGSFGRFLDLDQAIGIGMLPDIPRDRFHYLGNASLMGSYMTLVSGSHRRQQLEIAQRMTYIELSTDPAYMDQYTAALFLPHTDLTLFPSDPGH